MSELLHVSEVRSNVKCGIGCKLGPRTLVVGPNGSGKTSLLNSVELALRGAVTDFGPERGLVRKDTDILTMACNGAGAILAEVTLSNGATARYSKQGSKAARHEPPAGVNTEEVFPLWRLREDLFGAATETARRFLLSRVCGVLTAGEIASRVPSPLIDRFNQVFQVGRFATAVDALLGAVEEAARRARSASDLAAAAEALANSRAPQGAAPTDAEMSVAERAAQQAQEIAERVIAAEAYRAAAATAEAARLQTLQNREALSQSLQHLQKQREERIAVRASLPPASPEMLTAIALLPVIELHVHGQHPSCLVCGTGEIPAEVFPQRVSKLRDFVRYAKELEAKRSTLTSELAALDAQIASQRSTLDLLAKQPVEVPPSLGSATPTVGLGQAQESARGEQERLQRLKLARAEWDAAARAKDDVVRARLDGDAWKALRSELDKVIAELLDRSVAAFVSSVQRYLPATDVFFLDVRDGCRWGLMRNGAQHPVLCGAESARVCLALALATAGEEPGLKILVPEDRALDPQTLGAMMRALESAPFQVILLSVVEPADHDGAGWTIIRTQTGAHQALGVPEVRTSERKPRARAKRAAQPQPVPGAPPSSATLAAIMGDE